MKIDFPVCILHALHVLHGKIKYSVLNFMTLYVGSVFLIDGNVLALKTGFLLKEIEAGQFIQATPLQILEEEKYLLENLTDFNTFYWGDHGNNIVSSKGRLPEHREAFREKIDHAIATHPVTGQEVLKTSAW